MNDPHRPDEPQDDASDPEGEARQSPSSGRPEEDAPADDPAAAGPTPGESDAADPEEPAADDSASQTAGEDESGQEESTPEQPPAETDTAAEGDAGETTPDGGDTAGDGGDTDGGSGRAGLAAGITVLVLALLGLAGGGGWLGWRLQQLEQRVEQVPQERSEALAPLAREAALDDAVSRLEGEIEQLASQGSEATRAVAERVDELEAAVKTVRELAGRNQVDWRMAEVHYLLSLAARRVAIAGDRSAAIAALEAADRSIAALGDVRLVELRRAILDDITALRQVEPADVEGIALRIQSLLERVPDLPPATATVTAAADGNGDGDGGADGPRAWWERIKRQLSQYVVIRRQPDGGAPPRPQRDVSLPAAEKLGFALAEARRSALRHDSDAYGAAIARARELVDENFAADTPVTQRFADALAALSERAVVTTYPDLTATLEQAEQAAARLRSQRERPARAEPEEG